VTLRSIERVTFVGKLVPNSSADISRLQPYILYHITWSICFVHWWKCAQHRTVKSSTRIHG